MVTKQDVIRRLVDNLPKFLDKQPDSNNYKFLNSYSGSIRDFENSVRKLRFSLFIDSAEGVDLERVARLFGLNRLTGESDGAFRGRVKAFYQTVLKSGSRIGLKESISNALGVSTEDIIVIDVDNNIFDLEISVDSESDLSIFDNISSIIYNVKGAGTFYNEFTVSSSDSVFLINISEVNSDDKLL